MGPDIESRIISARKELESVRENKVRYIEKLENAKKQREDLVKQLNSLGIDPSKLETIISDKEKELENMVAEFEDGVASAASALKAIQDKLGEQ